MTFVCPYCGHERHSENGTGSDVICCGEVGHAKKMNIKTKYDPPPISTRVCDWSAIDDDTYEPGCPIGYGETEQEAIDDLMAQLEEQDLEMHLAEELNHPQAREDD